MSIPIPMTSEVAQCVGQRAENVENRSLLLDKFVSHKGWPMKNNEASSESLDRCIDCKLKPPVEKMRRAHVQHLGEMFRKREAEMRVVKGRLEARLAINLSDGMIENGGICLDRMFGTPYIPGSAIKGVCRHLALEKLRKEEMSIHLFQGIFGTAGTDFEDKGELKGWEPQQMEGWHRDQKGAVCFLVAYPSNEASLEKDITNVHFPKYYRSGKVEDLKEEEPQPNLFPVIKKGTEFLFFLSLNDQLKGEAKRKEVLDKAEELLCEAIGCSGIGAKTGAGYGWFTDLTAGEKEARRRKEEEEEQERKAQQAEKEAEEEKQRQRANMSPEERERDEVREKMEWLNKLSNEEFAEQVWKIEGQSVVTKKAIGELLQGTKKDRWKMWKKKKDENLIESIDKTLKAIGVELP